MQKPKNLLPRLFLCVFSRTAEPLVDFYCSNFWIFLFLFGADFFCRKERCFRPILYRPFLYRPILRTNSTKTPPRPQERPQRKKPREPVAPLNAHLEIPPQKDPAHAAPLQRGSIWHAAAPQKAPIQKSRKGAVPQRPPCKNPGSNSRGFG